MVILLLGTGNFGRVVPDDVLVACGKKSLPPSVSPASVATNLSDSQQNKKQSSVAPAQIMDGSYLCWCIFYVIVKTFYYFDI